MLALMASMQGDHPARPVLVMSNTPQAGGLVRAAAQGVPVAVVDHRPFGRDRTGFEDQLAQALDAARPDIIACAGFMRILGPGFLARHAGRILNIHPSLLPRYPGLRTHARAIAAGDTEAGCTVHEVTADLDAGAVLGQARVPVLAGDTEASLAARVLVQEHILYPAVLRRFACGDRTPVLIP